MSYRITYHILVNCIHTHILQTVTIDIRFCTHNLVLEDDQNDPFKYPKIIVASHALNHSLHILKMILRF